MLMYEKARSGHGPLSPHSDNSTDDLQVPDLHPPITIDDDDDDDDDILEPNSILPQHTATANWKPSISYNRPTDNDTDTGSSIGVASELMANYNRDSINSIDPAAGTGSLPNGIDDMSGIAILGWSLAAQSTVIAGLQGVREDAGESQCVPSHCVPSHCVASSPPPATSANHPRRQIVVTRTGRIAGTVTKQGGPAAETMADSAMHPGVKTSGMGAGKSQRRNRSKALLSPLPIPHGSTLPLDHQPARGRGRAQQLRMMTKDQIKVEAIARGEKNRKAARDARLRKKQHTEILEARVRELEARETESQNFIRQLQNKIRQLELGFQ